MKRLLLSTLLVALPAMAQDSAIRIRPGQWELTTWITDLEIPGQPAPVVAQAREMASRGQSQRRCITLAQTANPLRGMMTQADGNDCDFTESVFADGIASLAGTCNSPSGEPMRISFYGRYTATTIEGRLEAEVLAAPGAETPGLQMRMSGRMAGRRLGRCAPATGKD